MKENYEYLQYVKKDEHHFWKGAKADKWTYLACVIIWGVTTATPNVDGGYNLVVFDSKIIRLISEWFNISNERAKTILGDGKNLNCDGFSVFPAINISGELADLIRAKMTIDPLSIGPFINNLMSNNNLLTHQKSLKDSKIFIDVQ